MVRDVEKPNAPARPRPAVMRRIGGDVGLGRGLVADGALTHHVDADGGVRKQRAEVDVTLLAVERVRSTR